MEQYYGTGRRKEAVARVFLRPGNGKVTVNGQDFNEYFQGLVRAVAALEPLRAVDALGHFDAYITVRGGGRAARLTPSSWASPAPSSSTTPTTGRSSSLWASSPGTPAWWSGRSTASTRPAARPSTPSVKPWRGKRPGASPGRFSFGPSPAFWRTPP